MANQTENINNTTLSKIETIAEINQLLLGNLDDPAIWINGDNRENSIIIATLVDGGLATFNLDGTIKQNLTDSAFGDIIYHNVDVLYGFSLDEQIVDLVVASDRTNDTLTIFKIEADSRDLVDITSDNIVESIFGVDDSLATAYGLAGYKSPLTGQYYAFVSQADNNQIAQLELISDSTGLVTANVIRTIDLPIAEGEAAPDYQSEAIVVDQEQGIVYVAPEAQLQIFKFSAEPDDGNEVISLQPLAPPEEEITSLFENIVVFGDSLADVGNVNIATNGTQFPSPPYNDGRATNGLNIAEIIAEDLGLAGSASTPFFAGGDNYAFGGAELGDGFSTLGAPNIGLQILAYLYLSFQIPQANELFLIAAGANDIIANPSVEPQILIDRLVGHISTLATAGAKSFGIFDIGPVGDTPTARARGISDLANATVSEFNRLLDATLDDLRLDLDINIYELDSEEIYREIQSNPSNFGLTNIVDPSVDSELTVVPNPEEYFWWDTLHPTAAANTIFADAYIEQITNNSAVVGDIEGLSIYYGGDGTGYLVASSAGNSSFAVYSREGDNQYLGSFAIADNNILGIDRVNQSNGLDIVNVALGDDFPFGLLLAQDSVNEPDNPANFKLVPWEQVANSFNPPLTIDTDSFNPLNISNTQDKFNSIIYRFQNSDLPGNYFYTGEAERQDILQNFPNFIEEGAAFKVAVEEADDLIAIYRFQNILVPGTYLYVGEEERQSILENFANFIEEGLAFYVYDASAGIGDDIYRFQNSNSPGTYLYVGEGERQSILENFPNFIEEGVAFAVVI